MLRQLGEQLRLRMEGIPYVTHTSSTLIGGAPKLKLQLNEDKLRLAGLQLTDASSALNNTLSGVVGGEVLEGTERLPVRARLREQAWNRVERLTDIRVPLPGGNPETMGGVASVPLSALGEARLTPAQSPIARFNGEHSNMIQAYISRGVLPEEALKLLQAELSDHPLALPSGYRVRLGGDSNERADVVQKIMAPMGLILAALLATIVLTFNSWRLSMVALLVCGCSLGLSLLSLAIFSYPFGIQALIGVIGSIGVSINAAIIIITALQENSGAASGSLYAIRCVVMDSSRHIVSTTVTTFGGFLPLILEGSQFWPPFAMAIAGGVLLSTIVSFFLVPPLFLLVVKHPMFIRRLQPAHSTTTVTAAGKPMPDL